MARVFLRPGLVSVTCSLIFVAAAPPSTVAVITSTTTGGSWGSAATWVGGVVPGKHRCDELPMVSGRPRAVLLDRVLPAGSHHVSWQPALGPGVYFLRLDATGARDTRKILIVE